MLKEGPHKRMTEDVIEMMHLDRKREAARIFAKFCKMDCPEKRESWDSLLLSLYHFLINNGGMEEAAHLLWRPKLFDPRPRCTRDVWELFDRSNLGLLMGAASMCFDPETPCRMWDGSIKKVRDVRAGDVLCGNDQTPRNVLKTTSG
ncbi:MAG: hypothetical protein E4G90_02385, partial [Gemmatimonadales bacterium]